MEIVKSILDQLLPVVAIILISLASWGLKLLIIKLKLNVDMTKDSIVRQSVRAAIGAAEEWAARELKLTEKKKSGAEKAEFAKAIIKDLFPDFLPKQLDIYLDEEIAKMEGVGATKVAVGGTFKDCITPKLSDKVVDKLPKP